MSKIICPHCAGHIQRNTMEEKFWTQVDKNGSIPPHMPHLGNCWEWVGGMNGNGYGRFQAGENKSNSHRLSYELAYGPISSKDMFVCHKCDNPRCVCPDHLFLGTNNDNMRDMISKGRAQHPEGSDNSMSKLTDEQVREIRLLVDTGNLSRREIALMYNVSHSAINRIVWGISYKDVR